LAAALKFNNFGLALTLDVSKMAKKETLLVYLSKNAKRGQQIRNTGYVTYILNFRHLWISGYLDTPLE